MVRTRLFDKSRDVFSHVPASTEEVWEYDDRRCPLLDATGHRVVNRRLRELHVRHFHDVRSRSFLVELHDVRERLVGARDARAVVDDHDGRFTAVCVCACVCCPRQSLLDPSPHKADGVSHDGIPTKRILMFQRTLGNYAADSTSHNQPWLAWMPPQALARCKLGLCRLPSQRHSQRRSRRRHRETGRGEDTTFDFDDGHMQKHTNNNGGQTAQLIKS
mmetsp:Transcript_3157/g.7131  ORF Transcript_3157/g.7131 Transcript_3157/m.7131 type:complete len:218 (+) Transcript_3157:121-774(+)